MKKIFIVLYISFSFCKFSSAQILCIYCYEQNNRVSLGIGTSNLILNGSFENGCPQWGLFCPNSSSYQCDITDWICTGGGTATYAQILKSNSTIIADGAKAAYFGNNFCKSCSATTNDTSCINNISCTVTGIPSGYPVNTPPYGGTTGVSLEQTVTGLITGNTYVLEFWAGGEYGFHQRGLFAVDVGFGDTLLRDNPTHKVTGIGTRYIIEFNATSSSHTIKFTNWGHICGDCTELILDDVRLYTLAQLSASVPHCTLGIDASTSLSMTNVFPNPVTDELNIKTNSNELSEIIIYDIASGKLLQQTFINSASVNTEELAKGIYFYEIKPVPMKSRNKNGVVKKGKVVKG